MLIVGSNVDALNLSSSIKQCVRVPVFHQKTKKSDKKIVSVVTDVLRTLQEKEDKKIYHEKQNLLNKQKKRRKKN